MQIFKRDLLADRNRYLTCTFQLIGKSKRIDPLHFFLVKQELCFPISGTPVPGPGVIKSSKVTSIIYFDHTAQTT